MDEPKQPEAGADRAPTPKGEVVKVEPVELGAPASANDTAAAAARSVDELRRIAEKLKSKKEGETVVVPLVIRPRSVAGADDVSGAEPLELTVPTSAKAMAGALTALADEMQRAAGQLANRKDGNPSAVSIKITLWCNGGGDSFPG